MIDKTALINSITQKAEGILGSEKSRTREDIEKNIKALIRSSLAKLDLVTREEFDNQQAVLQHTRAKLERLEKEVEALRQPVDDFE